MVFVVVVFVLWSTGIQGDPEVFRSEWQSNVKEVILYLQNNDFN